MVEITDDLFVQWESLTSYVTYANILVAEKCIFIDELRG